MNYCSLDEAFGTTLKNLKIDNGCPKKVKSSKINCNKNKNRFTEYEKENDIDQRTINNNVDELNNNNFNNLEPFENYSPNEIFEYNEKDNESLEKNENNSIEPVNKSVNKKKKRKNNLNPQINEINNKINYLINQVNNKELSESNNLENNVYDIVLFILFGIFVIALLEGLYKLVTRILRRKIFSSNI